MKSKLKKYNTAYKKGHVEKDMYLPRLDPKGVIQCTGCGAFHYRRHWTLTPPTGFSSQIHSHPVFCPACRRFKIGFPVVNSLCVPLKLQTGMKLRGFYAMKNRRRGRKIPWSGLCTWMRRMADGGLKPRPRNWRSGWDARLRRQGAESSLTCGGIIISSSVWCGKRMGLTSPNRTSARTESKIVRP